jgi:hypothetical protein
MSPQEALQFLDYAASRAPLTRPEHAQAIQALQVIQARIAELEGKAKNESNFPG